jgi:hypothetical protein
MSAKLGTSNHSQRQPQATFMPLNVQMSASLYSLAAASAWKSFCHPVVNPSESVDQRAFEKAA